MGALWLFSTLCRGILQKRSSTLSISPPLIRFTARRNKTMRFMMIVKANKDSEAGVMPGMELIEAMGKFNEEMVKAGVLVSADGLQASSKRRAGQILAGTKTGRYGRPVRQTRELIAGYWVIDVPSKSRRHRLGFRALPRRMVPIGKARSRSVRCSRPRISAPRHPGSSQSNDRPTAFFQNPYIASRRSLIEVRLPGAIDRPPERRCRRGSLKKPTARPAA